MDVFDREAFGRDLAAERARMGDTLRDASVCALVAPSSVLRAERGARTSVETVARLSLYARLDVTRYFTRRHLGSAG